MFICLFASHLIYLEHFQQLPFPFIFPVYREQRHFLLSNKKKTLQQFPLIFFLYHKNINLYFFFINFFSSLSSSLVFSAHSVFFGGDGYDETQGYLLEDFLESTKGVGLMVPSWGYRPPLTLSNMFLSLVSRMEMVQFS